MSYYGWNNWETWNCVLWLQNEETIYNHYHDIAMSLSESKPNSATTILADIIENDLIENAPTIEEPSLYQDLMSAELRKIDYYEVAESFFDE